MRAGHASYWYGHLIPRVTLVVDEQETYGVGTNKGLLGSTSTHAGPQGRTISVLEDFFIQMGQQE